MATINFPNGPRYTNLVGERSVLSAQGGPAKSSRFMARITKPIDGLSGLEKDLSLLCEAAEFPGRGFMAVDNRYYGPNFKVPYQTTYEDLTLTFILRDRFLERQYFDDWMNLINPIDTYNFRYKNTYTTNIELFQLSDIGSSTNNGEYRVNTQYAFTFEKAYPILVNPQPVTWADDNFHRLSVSFTYNRWYRRGLDKYTTSGMNGDDLALTEVNVPITTNNGEPVQAGDPDNGYNVSGGVGWDWYPGM